MMKKLWSSYKFLFCGVILVILISSCQSNPKVEKKTTIIPDREVGSFFDTTGGKLFSAETSVEEIVQAANDSSYIRTQKVEVPIYSRKVPNKSNISIEKLPFDLTQKARKKCEFNFSDASFYDIVALFAKELGFKYILSEDIKTKTTLSCQGNFTAKEIWDIFNVILQKNGLYFTIEKGIFNFSPMANAGQSNTIDSSETNLDIHVFELKHINSKNVAAQLAPFVSKGVKILELPLQNSILVMDNKLVLQKIKEIVKALDVPSKKDWYKCVFDCQNIPSARLVEELSQIFPVLGLPVSTNSKKEDSSGIQIISIDRLQLIVASAPTPEILDEIKRWISILDKNDVGDQEKVFIYQVMNSKAEQLTEALSVIFSLDGTAISTENKTSDTVNGVFATSKQEITSKKSTPSTKGKIGTITSDTGSIYDTPVKIYADGVNNRLIIKTKPRTYAMIRALLNRIDILPQQVLLQVLVVEVGLNDTTKFGVEFSMAGGSGNVGTTGGVNYKNLNPGSNNEYGGKFFIYNPSNPEQKYGYIQALSGMTDVKVISSPQILVVSHTQAQISVGNKVPLVNSEITNSQSVTNPTDTSLVRNIQYQDTGIILKILPQVTKSGQILLVLDQTVSEAVRNTTSNIDSPEIQERSLKTTMMLANGQTILSGGMIKEKVTDNLDSIPVIDNIPFLRRLIGDTDYQKERTEMLILVSATIISKETQLEELVKRYRDSVELLQTFHQDKTIIRRDPEKMRMKAKEAGLVE